MYLSIAIIAVFIFAAWLADWEVHLVRECGEDLEQCRVRNGHTIEGGETTLLRGIFSLLLAAYWVAYSEALVPMIKQVLEYRGYCERPFMLVGGGQ